jgi:hypothetical protein
MQGTAFNSIRGWQVYASMALLALSLCSAWPAPVLNVPEWRGQLTVDGKLDEPCFLAPPTLDQFVVAGQPGLRPQKTEAWLFWQREQFIFAFECEDADIVAAPPSTRKHDVDGQDRVELLLWSGRTNDAYGCLELGAAGAVHDYLARFYRRFDDAWSPAEWKHAVSRTATGYLVEGVVSRRELEALGLQLKPGARWRVGLFRADFSSRRAKEEPTWIAWVDARGPKADFHVVQSFGEIVLLPAKQ